MKILYLDFLCPKAHLNLDINLINRLSNIGEVIIVSQKGRYNSFAQNIKNIEKKSIKIKQGRISNRLSSLKIMLVSAFESKKIDYDFIVVSSFETIMFVIGRYFFKKDDKIILFHHFNTDELNNKIKAWFFRRYMNKVTHIVFAEFIKDYLINNFDINPKKIFVMPHHMNIIDENTTMKKEFDCVGLSNSNDEEIISEILQKEKQEKVFKKMGCKVVLKSKIHEFDDGYLKIVKGYLEKEVFDNYINNTQSIYMPFPSSFQYRMSGTLIDALSNGKIVYGSDIPVMRYYSKRHPNICKVVDNADSFVNKLLNKKDNLSDYTKDFERFKQEHSEEKIEGVFRKIFNSIQ